MPQKHKVANEDANGLNVADYSKRPRAEEPSASNVLPIATFFEYLILI